jgi:hypothetical protein
MTGDRSNRTPVRLRPPRFADFVHDGHSIVTRPAIWCGLAAEGARRAREYPASRRLRPASLVRGTATEKCTIRTSSSSFATAGEAEKPRPARARGERILGLPDRGAGGLGAPKDGVLHDGDCMPSVMRPLGRELRLATIGVGGISTNDQLIGRAVPVGQCRSHQVGR